MVPDAVGRSHSECPSFDCDIFFPTMEEAARGVSITRPRLHPAQLELDANDLIQRAPVSFGWRGFLSFLGVRFSVYKTERPLETTRG